MKLQTITSLKTQLTDISKKLDQEQQKSHQMEDIIALMPGHVYWKDVNGVYMGCNDQQANMLGYARGKDIIGKTDADLSWGKGYEKFIEIDKKVMETKQPYEAEEPIIRPDNKPVVFLSKKVPLFDKDGEIIGILGISIDITVRKQMEKELEQAKEAAEVADKVKTTFIRNMQHDIRTPLGGIWSMADILEGIPSNHKTQEFITNIKLCSKELLGYCDSILDFANIEQGYQPVLFKKFNARSLITRVALLEETAAKAKGLKLIINYPKTLQNIFIGDEFRIYRILVNLISNAIKFTEKGYIEIQLKEAKRNVDKREVILQFIVRDTGIGIQKDKQKIIFEKFSKLNPSNQGRYKGLGLGLRIVKEFMEDIGGEIDVESKPTIGTTLVCTIPLKLPLVDEIIGDNENE